MKVVYSGTSRDGELLSRALGDVHEILTWDRAPSRVPCLVWFGAPVSDEAWSRSPSVIVVLSEDAAWESVTDREVLGFVVRGPSEEAQLRALAHCAERLESARRYAKLTTSPFSHDLRGIASVVRLSAQVLVQKGLDSHGQRLNTAALRMSDLIEDLQVAVLARAEGEGSLEPKAFGSIVSELDTWFEANHRDRKLELTTKGMGSDAPSPASLPFILRGIVDGATRMTSRAAVVSLHVEKGSGRILFESTAPCSEPSPDVMELLDTDPEEWAMSGLPGSLFRLVTARLLARAAGGELIIERHKELGRLRLGGQIPG